MIGLGSREIEFWGSETKVFLGMQVLTKTFDECEYFWNA
jgi:hypothetical protein